MNTRAVFAQARIESLITLRRGESLLVTMFIPIGVLVFFSTVGKSQIDTSLEFLVPGVLALAVMSSAMVSLGIATGFERRFGVLKRLGTTPLSRSGLLTAKILNVVLIETMQIAILLGVAALLGYHLGTGALLALIYLLGGSVTFAALGLFLAGSLRADANLAIVNALYLVFLFFGGIAYPLDKLPKAIESIALLFPAAAFADLLRSALVGEAFPLSALLVMVFWTAVFVVATMRTFRWEE